VANWQDVRRSVKLLERGVNARRDKLGTTSGAIVEPVTEHAVRLLVGPLQPLRAVQAMAAMARIFALTPAAYLWALPLDDEVHDTLHAAFGTGEWLRTGAQLTSTDLITLARLSQGSAMAYIETNYKGPTGTQSAALWRDGVMAMPPVTLDASVMRPAQFWPINAALKSLGVVAQAAADEFTVFGLMGYRSNRMIAANGAEVKRGRSEADVGPVIS
jgi:hypothetical protein